MCIVIVCFPASDAISLEISLSVLIKLLFYMTENSRQKAKGDKKLYFTHYLYVLIIFFNTGLDKSAFSNLFFGNLVFRLSVFSVLSVCSVFRFHLDKLYKIPFNHCLYRSQGLFSHYKKQLVKTNTTYEN